MGIGMSTIKLYMELWERGLLGNVKSVMEMGSQELHITKANFEDLVRAAGITTYRKENFPNQANWPGAPRDSAKSFYEMLGAEEYNCIDMNALHGAIPLDLNQPLTDSSLYGKYDLVTDFGTNEHVFNVGEAYRTMHRLCKPGGLIVIMQAIYGANGYHNFDPAFFEGLASANNYRILFSSLVVTVRRRWFTQLEEREGLFEAEDPRILLEGFHIPLSNDLLEVIDWSRHATWVGISFVLQKQSDDDFRYAYQGSFQAKDQGHLGYRLQFQPRPPARTYVPLLAEDIERELGDIRGGVLARHLSKRLMRRMKRISRLG